MSIPFDRFAAVVDRAGDQVFGEEIMIEPEGRGGGYTGPVAADPCRPAKTVTGCFSAKAAEEPLSGEASGPGPLPRIAGRETVLRLSAAVAASLGYELRQGDRITRLGRGADNAFAVVDVIPSDLGELTINLVDAY